MKRIEQMDPFEQRLKVLSRDQSQEGLSKCWNIQIKGDTNVYESLDGKHQKNLGVIVVKSLVWKGFVHLYQE